MPVVAVVPVKSFQMGKGRLADALSADVRQRLGERLAERTVVIAEEAGLIPVVVAGDGEVAEWALRRGIPSIPDPGEGLSAAAAEGVAWAEVSGTGWMIIHSDLPLLTADDLRILEGPVLSGETVLAPSSDGGTSVFAGTGTVRLSYGMGSFGRHLANNPNSRIVVRLGLLHDLDSMSDLASARRHPRGAWLEALL